MIIVFFCHQYSTPFSQTPNPVPQVLPSWYFISPQPSGKVLSSGPTYLDIAFGPPSLHVSSCTSSRCGSFLCQPLSELAWQFFPSSLFPVCLLHLHYLLVSRTDCRVQPSSEEEKPT